jgi:NCS2 family nucleobase:cation symporter-2
MGIFSKFGAVFVAMPASLLGGMTTFLFASVSVAGLRILTYVTWSRRTRFIATTSLSLGFASIVVPDWFSYFFTYAGPNTALAGFLNALTLIVEESYLITMIIAIPLNLLLPYGDDDEMEAAAEARGEGLLLPTTNIAGEQGRGESVEQEHDKSTGEV